MEVRVSVRGVDHSVVAVPQVSPEALREVLADVFERMGCEAGGREVGVSIGGRVFYSEEPEGSAEEVAAELWGRIRVLDS